MLLCHLILNPWNFESCTSNFCCFSLPSLDLTFLMLLFPYYVVKLTYNDNHILLCQIWNHEILKPSFQTFAVCLCLLNLKFPMLTFEMLTFPMLLFQNEIYSFKIRNVPFSNTKKVPISNKKKCPFEIRKSGIFKKDKPVFFKYKKCLFFKYENVPFENFEVFKYKKYAIFKYEKLTVFKYK